MKNYVKYQNTSHEAMLQQVEFAQTAQGDYFTFLYSNRNSTSENFKKRVEEITPNAAIVSESALDGQHIIVLRSDKTPQEQLAQWKEHSGEKLVKEEPKKKEQKTDLIKVRGWVGVLAQILMLASGKYDPDNTRGSKAKRDSSFINLVGYPINILFGVQKEMDHVRLNFAKKLVNKDISQRHKDTEKLLPTATETKRTKPAKDAPSWMERNSIRLSSGIKLYSKVPGLQLRLGEEARSKILSKAPALKSLLKEKKTPKQTDASLKLSSMLSITGKMITVLGMPEDPYQLEKNQDPISKLRRQSNFISSLFDWTSTFSLFMGVFMERKPEEEQVEKKWYQLFDRQNHKMREDGKYQWWQLGATFAFIGALVLKAISPYTEKRLDADNLLSHTTLAVASGVKEDYGKEVSQITASMMNARELPEIHEKGFGRTFTEIADRLEMHQGIAITAPETPVEQEEVAEEKETKIAKSEKTEKADKKEEKTETKEVAEAKTDEEIKPDASETTHAKKVEKKGDTVKELAQEERPEKLAERLVAAKETALEPALMGSG